MRLLDVDIEIAECDAIMDETESQKESDPDMLFKYGMARNIKIYLLRIYYRQQNQELKGHWQFTDRGEICNICRTPRNISELDGTCVGCGAIMNGGDSDAQPTETA